MPVKSFFFSTISWSKRVEELRYRPFRHPFPASPTQVLLSLKHPMNCRCDCFWSQPRDIMRSIILSINIIQWSDWYAWGENDEEESQRGPTVNARGYIKIPYNEQPHESSIQMDRMKEGIDSYGRKRERTANTCRTNGGSLLQSNSMPRKTTRMTSKVFRTKICLRLSTLNILDLLGSLISLTSWKEFLIGKWYALRAQMSRNRHGVVAVGQGSSRLAAERGCMNSRTTL